MLALKLSTDRKVTNSVTKSGNPNMQNTFGLPAGTSCPGMTDACESVCYARKAEKQYVNVDKNMQHNWELISNATLPEQVELLSEIIGNFQSECERKGVEKLFRIHWDGDFYSYGYALAWNFTIQSFPDVKFWAYTRTFEIVEVLANLPNLSLYLSTDTHNVHEARRVSEKYNVPMAGLGINFKAASVIVDNAVRCPENNGALPLIDTKGSACVRCGLCIRGDRNVLFSITKK